MMEGTVVLQYPESFEQQESELESEADSDRLLADINGPPAIVSVTAEPARNAG
jgi:hypothetical protein